MKQYVQTDLEADRQVANTLAELIIGGSLASTAVASLANHMQKALSLRHPRSSRAYPVRTATGLFVIAPAAAVA